MKKSYRRLRRRPLFTPVWLSLLGGIAFLLALSWVWNSLGTTTVILARHAETEGIGAERKLSAAGIARAKTLAAMLEDVPLTAIYISEYPRTRATGEVVAAATGGELVEVPAADTAKLARLLKGRKDQVVLVVGHSNTLPDLVARLGGRAISIDESDHAQVMVLTTGWLERTRILPLRYGP